jgi:hypothetical protein
MRIGRLLEVRHGEFGHHEGSARVDLVHQIEALHVCRLRVGERNGARVIDHDVEAAEGRNGPFERLAHLPLVTHVDDERQRLAAGFLDFFRGRVDRAR